MDDYDYSDIDETMLNRRLAMRNAQNAASRGHDLAGMLGEMERLASPFFLGMDEDADSSDLDVYP